MTNTEEPKKDFKEFSRFTIQNILYRMAKASEDRLGRGFLIEYEVVMKLKARIGDAPLKEVWGKEFEVKLAKLKKLGSYVSWINLFLMNVDDDKFLKEESLRSPKFIKARHVYATVVNHLDLMDEAFYILLDNTKSLKMKDIPNEYFGDKIDSRRRPSTEV